MRPRSSLILVSVAVALLAACSSPFRRPPPEPPTLKSLASRQYTVKPDAGVQATEEDAARAYRDFLAASPREPQRQEALRRLGDLEMDLVDTRSANGATASADYKAAITQYQDFLKTYPNDSGNDRVLYQLARAYELSGELETSLKTLDQLVLLYPTTRYRDEAQFRRGEMMFALREYPRAEAAYLVTMSGNKGSPYYERALYMHGWSQFKQGRLDESLQSFFGVLDLKLAGRGNESDLEKLPGLTRADRELVEDTFRVTSISLANLQGPASIPPYVNSPVRREYEFRVYQQLGELYIKQERVKDAADTFSAFRAALAVASGGAGAAGARHRHLCGGRFPDAGTRREEAVRHSLRCRQRLSAQQPGRLDSQRRATGEDAPGRARALLPRRCAEDEEVRGLPGGCALVSQLPDFVPAGSAGGAEQLPAGRVAVRGRAVFRGGDRIREVGLRLSAARQERRCRLRGAARLRAAGEALERSRGADGPARRRRQRAPLREGISAGSAQRAGADQRRREAVCTERRRAGCNGRATGAGAAARTGA